MELLRYTVFLTLNAVNPIRTEIFSELVTAPPPPPQFNPLFGNLKCWNLAET